VTLWVVLDSLSKLYHRLCDSVQFSEQCSSVRKSVAEVLTERERALVADSIEGDIAPGNSWQVILNEQGKTEWLTKENGVVTETSDKEPLTTAGQRAEAAALRIVPDTGEL